MTDLTALLAAVTELTEGYAQTREDLLTYFTGPADGGPNGDGFYPITAPNGIDVQFVPSPLCLYALLGGTSPTPTPTPTPGSDGALYFNNVAQSGMLALLTEDF